MAILESNYWFSGGTEAPDFGSSIPQSLRFRGAQRLVGPDPRPAGDFTVSFWFKRADAVDSVDTMTFLSFTGNQSYQLRQDVLICRRSTSTDQVSDGVIRDPSAWYQAVFVNDGGVTTLHLNGVEQANSHNTPNGGDNMTIGSNNQGFMDNPLQGYLADYYFIDGQALEPTAFGRYNDDGQWVPRDVDFTPATPRYSDFLFADQTGNNTNAPNFDATTPAQAAEFAFNGSTTSGASAAGAASTIIFRPAEPIEGVTGLRVFTDNQARIWVNETLSNITQGATSGWADLGGAGSAITFPLDLTNLALNGNAGVGASGSLNAIEVTDANGTRILTNPFMWSADLSAVDAPFSAAGQPQNAFNGQTGTTQGAELTSNGAIVWDPTPDIVARTSIRVFTANANCFCEVNSLGSVALTSGNWTEVSNGAAFPITIETITVARSSSPPAVSAYEIDGQIYIDGVNPSYGANGFHLTFEDPNDIGKDYSGNNNNFTETGFDIAPVGIFSNFLTCPSGFDANGPGPAFNGSTANQASALLGGAANPLTFAPTTDINYNQLEVFCTGAAGSMNIAIGDTTVGANGGWVEVENAAGTISATRSLTITPTGTATAVLSAVRINGTTILVDNTGVDYDSMLDSPTQNYATLNPLPSTAGTNISKANLTWSASSANQASQTIALPTSGQYYFEYQLTGNNAVVGAVTSPEAPRLTVDNSGALFLQNYNAGTAASATIAPNADINGSATIIPSSEIQSWAYDAGAGTIEVRSNNVLQYTIENFDIDGPFYVQVDRSGTEATEVSFNFGQQQPFFYTPPAGFAHLQTQNLPAATIKNGTDYFRAVTAPGAAILDVAQGNVNGFFQAAGFRSGLWCIKDMDNTNTQYQFVDAIRGKNALIKKCPGLDNTTAYQPPAGESVAWCWQASEVMPQATRESGDITVTAGLTNQTAGFSILEFEGNTQEDQTVAHGLTEPPEFMIAIAQDNTNSIPAWSLFAPGAPSNGTGLLNTTAALSLTHVDAVDDQFITISSNTAINSGTVSMYLWHSVPGYSAFGQYIGNSLADGPFIYTGFKPSWILIKRASADASGHWTVYDSTRSVNNPAVETLRFDVNNGEGSSATNAIDFLSNGFKLRTGVNQLNASVRFVYAAFAECPFGAANAAPTTAALVGPPQISGINQGLARGLRFRGNGNFLRRVQTAGDRRTFTYSVWFKKTNSGSDPNHGGAGFFELLGEAGNSANDRTGMRLEDDVMKTYNLDGSSINFLYEGTALLRDPSAWYHFVWSWDTTQAASADRLKFYINGVQQTLTETNSFGQNSETHVNENGVNFSIGELTGGTRDQLNGYLADVYMIDGQALEPTVFGEFNSDNVWVPIEDPTITDYGPNGFKLVMDPAFQNGNILEDQSGNGNNFTMNNFDTDDYFSADFDWMKDGPMNNYCTANPLVGPGAAPGPNTFTTELANLQVGPGGSGGDQFISSTIFQTNQDVYVETTVTDVQNQIEVGFTPDGVRFGGGALATSGSFFGFNQSSQVWTLDEDGTQTIISLDATDQTFGFHVDVSAGQIDVYNNDALIGSSTGWTFTDPRAFSVGSNGGPNVVTMTWNYGQQPFSTQPAGLTGAQSLQTQNLPAVTIPNGRDHFQAITEIGEGPLIFIPIADDTTPTTAFVQNQWTYLGTTPFSRQAGNFTIDLGGSVTTTNFTYSSGSSGVEVLLSLDGTTWRSLGDQVTTGTLTWTDGNPFRYVRHYVNAAPAGYTLGLSSVTNSTASPVLFEAQETFPNGFWWIKDIDNTNQHQLVDSQNISGGVTTAITCPQISPPQQTYVAPAGDCVAWCWSVDNNQSQNDDGNQTSTTMTNTAAGFSIINYAGTGNNATTIGHGLTQAPEFMLMKARSVNSENWIVYFGSNSNFLRLNTPDQQFGSGTLVQNVTDTVIQLGDNTAINGNTGTNRIYAWHSVPGYSAFGSFTGVDDANGVFVSLGFKPAFLLIKQTDASRSWNIWDNSRSPHNPCDVALFPDEDQGENSNMPIDFLSNGFKARKFDFNYNSDNPYIYAAFAENPFGGSNVSPVPAR